MSVARQKRCALEPGGVVVKSAGRVLMILEYFDAVQRDANAIDVCSALGFPQSSTSLLLRSLVTLGYLRYNSRTRTYSPTNRVPLLGNWVGRDLFLDGKLYRLFERLEAETGCLVVLAARNVCFVQYIYLSKPQGADDRHAEIGSLHPLTASACGYAILSTVPDAEAGKIIRRLNAEAVRPEFVTKASACTREIAVVKGYGYARGSHPTSLELGEIALPVSFNGAEAHAIGVVGPAEQLAQNETALVAALKAGAAEHLGDYRKSADASRTFIINERVL